MSAIRENLESIKFNIKESANNAKRSSEDITLIAVTKTVDVDKILEAIEYGVTDVGENKPQELARKYDIIGDKVKWHLIGSLQTNKVKYIIDKVHMIHSLDRESLCEEIQKRAEKIDRIIDCLVQVNISKEDSKHGLYEEDVIDFITNISNKYTNIRIKGLMTMAPFTENEDEVREVFRSLKNLSLDIDKLNIPNVSMKYLSMGMSNDYKIAVEEGSTIVRVGTSIFEFMNGAVYVLDGGIQKVSKGIFILAPNNVDIDSSIKKELESKTLFPWQSK